MFGDFHIHSCLSPCANNEMTLNNICNMALIKGLDMIAVTDHNSFKQCHTLKKVAENVGIQVIYGAELETSEEVHVLALFETVEQTEQMQAWVDQVLPNIPNRKDFFGEQLLLDEDDQVIGEEDRLLLVSLQASLEECIQQIHHCHGLAIPAHVINRENGLIEQLGFIPMDLDYDGLEVKSLDQKELVIQQNPWVKEDTIWLFNSDAHQLIDINEADHEVPKLFMKNLRGDCL